MKYDNITNGVFISRPNRFIAHVKIGNKTEICHVKNTGRCKELLVPNAQVYVQHCNNITRKTKYDLIAVNKSGMIVNIDSQAPNRIFYEWIKTSDYFGSNIITKPEFVYKKSRFDFFVKTPDKKILIEVKGVTLENNGIASFPDAPTLRGLKHINELTQSIREGYEAYVFFVIQMDGMNTFVPNRLTQPEFGDALKEAQKAGVNIRALSCHVTPKTIYAHKFIDVNLEGGGYFG